MATFSFTIFNRNCYQISKNFLLSVAIDNLLISCQVQQSSV